MASRGKTERLAVVLTGNATRAAALLGALQAIEEAGQKPELLVGVSGGAIAAALTAASGSATVARDALYELVGRHSWQELADIDFGAVRDMVHRPYETNGFLTGAALHQALLDTPIGHKGFQHLNTPLFVLATDLNSGREVVFGNQVDETATGPIKFFARTSADLERVNVAAACRASMATPGLFKPVSLDHYCLVDGTLRQRRALSVAALQPGITRILWLNAGVDENETFSLVTDYAGQSFAAGLLHSLTVAGMDQFDPHTGDPALAGKAVRYVNLGVSSIGPAELAKTQQIYESGRRSTAALLAAGLFGEAAALSTSLESQAGEDGPRWAATRGQGGRDVVAITDLMPPVQQEFGYEFDDYLQREGLAKLSAREPAATADWSRTQAESELGVSKLAGLFVSKSFYYGWRGLTTGLRTAWQALSLDNAVDHAGEAVADGALWVSDTLGRNGGKRAKARPSAPAESSEPGEDALTEPEAAIAGDPAPDHVEGDATASEDPPVEHA